MSGISPGMAKGLSVLIFILLFLLPWSQVAAAVENNSVEVNYTEDGQTLFQLSAPWSGCTASLGNFPHWCLGNVHRCGAAGFSLGFWLQLRPANVTSEEAIVLTNGGASANSDGFFVRRRYGDQVEIGVAKNGSLWSKIMRLRTDDSWCHVTVTWSEADGLSVGIDGIQWLVDVTLTSRSFSGAVDGQELIAGLDKYGRTLTSSCSFSVRDVVMANSARDAVTFSQHPDFNTYLLTGCTNVYRPAAGTVSFEFPASPNSITLCRQSCSDSGRMIALVRHNNECLCSDVVPSDVRPSNSCSADDWSVYRVHHLVNDTTLKLRAWSVMTSGRPYTKPGEDIAFFATLDFNLDPSLTFTLTFDDGTSLRTSTFPVYHAFKTAGAHQLQVTTQVGVVQLNASVSALVEDVDEGVAPQKVTLTSWHDTLPKSAKHEIFVVDERVSNCTLTHGDEVLVPNITMTTTNNISSANSSSLTSLDQAGFHLPPFPPYGPSLQVGHTYAACGRYWVTATCRNAYGRTAASAPILARELRTFPLYSWQGQGLNVSVAGGASFLQSLVVEVNKTAIDFDASENLVTLKAATFTPCTDNLVEVKYNGTLLTRHIVRSERRVARPTVTVDTAAGEWSLTANVSVTVQPCDFVTLVLDFGQGDPPVIVYSQEVTKPLVFWRTVTFGNLGTYLINATLSNDVSTAASSVWVSVEVPIVALDVTSANITSLTSPVTVTVDVNSGAAAPDRVLLTVDYGDGKEPREVLHVNQGPTFRPLTLDYIYSGWGIYTITVTASNNVTALSRTLLVQVGQNITSVDLTTPNERVSLKENVTLLLTCPTGSDVTYTLDFGDNTSVSAREIDAVTTSSHTVVRVTSPATAVVTHQYASPGNYRVTLTATNAFSAISATLCPTVVVANSLPSDLASPSCLPPTIRLSAPFANSSLTQPAVVRRSLETRINVQATPSCPQDVSRLYFSWKATRVHFGEQGGVWETTESKICIFQEVEPTLVLPARALPYGLYRLTVTVSPVGYDLISSAQDIYMQVAMSNPISAIEGGEVATVMIYATAILDISQSHDPDLDTDVRRGLTFHMFCLPESMAKDAKKLSLTELTSASSVLGNKTMFRTTTKNDFWLYEFKPCFNDTSALMADLTVFNGKVSFPASYFLRDYFSFAMLLFTERGGMVNRTSQILEVRTTNVTLEDLGSLLDLALNADPDTAIRLIGGAADAILSADSSSAEQQEKLAKSAEAVVSTLGSVAKRVENANQATKCAGAIKTMTSNSGIVSQASRGSAAEAFLNLANGTSGMEDATVDDASSFAGETLGGLGNIFPATVVEKTRSPRELTPAPSSPETTTVAEILAARNLTLHDYATTPAFVAWTTTTATPTTTRPFTTRSATTATPLPSTTTTTMATTTTTTTTVTPTTTTITMTIPPRSSTGSFSFNGSNYTISGITISTLATTSATTTTTVAPTTTTEPPISEWMLAESVDEPENTKTPYEKAAIQLHDLPLNPSYDELFAYIFDDCLLFRKVMKSPEVQYRCPCMSSTDVNLMKCEGQQSLQERVFRAMTYLEHPDDIYEVYLKPLNEERRKRDELRRLMDMQVAGAGNAALGTIADTVSDKTGEGDKTERAFNTPRLAMKLQKLAVNGTNATESGVAAKQSMGSAVGSFAMPTSVLAGASDCPNMNTMFLADTDNPYTYGEEASSVGKGVMSLGYSCNGQKVEVVDTPEPMEMWMERDPQSYKPGLFVLLTDVSNKERPQINYHPVNLTEKNSSLQMVVRPVDANDAFDVYVSFGIRPNVTHHDYADWVPKADLSHLARYESLAVLESDIKEELLYTVTVPGDLTAENGSYWVGIKLRKGTVSVEQGTSNTSYTLLNLPSGCRFWDETNNTWSSNGCQVGELTSRWKVQCFCNHLTSFGSDAVVPPNTIDFTNVWAKFANLNENAAVFSTVISLIGLYVILLIYLRYKDKQDLIKWGAIPLEDNLPTDTYHYQLTVYTGVRKDAGTDSRIRFILSGEECDTGVRRLFDGNRKHFARGSIFNFVLSAENCLGNLTFLRIWHDNGGKGKNKSWYLDQVQVTDLQTGEKSIFLCDRWLAVEEDDGFVDRILPVAGIEDLIAFKHLFTSSARKKLANDHLWVSVFSRPTRSNFTRVQRLSCCMSLLFLTMITNAMFFKTEDKQEQVTGIKLGPLQFTLGQVFISFVSTVIVFPPNFLLVVFFKRCRQKHNAIVQLNQSAPKKNQKYRWKNIGSSSAIWGQRATKTRMQKLKESINGILTFHQKSKYEDPAELAENEEQQTNVSSSSSDLTGGMKTKRKKKPWTLPHWCIYVAWVVCFLSIVVSGFFTILYSMEWGAAKANEWLITFVMSFFQNVVIIQPAKVLVMVALISCILKKPDLDEEELDENLDKVISPEVARIAAKDKDPVSLSQVQLERQMGHNEYAPPDTGSLAAAREQRLMEIKMEALLKEIAVYFFFLLVIFFISYQQRDPVSYNFGVNVRNLFVSGFEDIKTVADYWVWLEGTFLPALFATQYANGTDISFWKDRACIGDLETRRIGVARLRQFRVKNDTCTIQKEMAAIINHCRGAYSWTDDDTKDYYPGWVLPTTEVEKDALKDQEGPFVYQNSVKMKNVPYVGTLTTYKGGGYALLTRRDLCRTQQAFQFAKDNNWLDLNTRAVLLEFTVYNPNVNLFASHILLTEFITTGGATARIDIKIFRLLSYIGGWGMVVLLFEVTYALFTVYFFVRCIRMVRKQRLQYFTGFWNILEFVLLCLAVACIVFYSFKHILTEVAMTALKNRESDGFVNFQSIALYDETYGYIMSAVVFMATIQFLKLLQFNRKMGMLGATIQLAAKDLKVFSVAFLLYFLAFVITAFLLFGQTLYEYSSFISACESMFAFALGAFDFESLSTAQPFLGPIFFFTYIMVVYIGLMSIFLTIIGDSFTRVKANTALQSNEYEIVDFMWRRFKGVLGYLK